MTRLYYRSVFEQSEFEKARNIILTPERDVDTETRWERETPDTINLFVDFAGIKHNSVILDFGCGIGRLAKELLSRLDVTVIGVDISERMRSFATSYVAHPNFVVLSPAAFMSLTYANSLHVDFAYSVYALQHVLDPRSAILAIGKCARHGIFLINSVRRAVPTLGQQDSTFAWTDDGVDIRRLCLESFPKEKTTALSPELYALHEQQFCSYFYRD